MTEVVRCRTKWRSRRAGEGCRIKDARWARSGEHGMHGRGGPDRLGDRSNRVALGAPLRIGVTRIVRIARHLARLDSGHRDDVVCRNRAEAGGGSPQERGQADREKHQATHGVIVTCHRGYGQTAPPSRDLQESGARRPAGRWCSDECSGRFRAIPRCSSRRSSPISVIPHTVPPTTRHAEQRVGSAIQVAELTNACRAEKTAEIPRTGQVSRLHRGRVE